MRFEYIVLLVIGFNVITAVMQRRAKKARAEEAARSGRTSGEPEAFEAAEDANPWQTTEDEDYQDPFSARRGKEEGRRFQREDRRPERPEPVSRTDSDSRNAEARKPASDSPQVGKMPSLGRDILDQLARDLGLKIPRPQTPEPIPSSSPTARDSGTNQPAVRQSESARKSFPPTRDTARRGTSRGMESVSQSPKRSVPSRALPIEETSLTHSMPASSRARAMTPYSEEIRTRVQSDMRPDLHDIHALRAAIVAKEILDVPVSRRVRR